MEVVKRVPPGHSNVRQVNKKKSEVVVGVRGAEEHGGGLLGLRYTFGDSGVIKTPW